MSDRPIPFGKYVLLERINVGGMAEVFKAKAFGVEGFERLVAVKRILPSIAEDTEFITMFVDEAKIAVQLTHASIAQIFDLGKVDDSYFIAMEYVHGKDLRAIFDRVRKRGEPVSIPMCCYVIMKVCEGLDYAHNKRDPSGRELRLVHRDVSPQNVIISYDGEVKLIDFGIAKAAGKTGTTQAGMLKGKFGYMSPEQVRGMPIDRRSDIFALAIVLYELLTGERLFIGESDFATLEKIRNAEIIPPTTYNPKIPEELEAIVMRGLAKEVEDRYQTAMDLHDDLQSFMYTSGNFFARKDLSLHMREAFAEDLAKDKSRDEARDSMMNVHESTTAVDSAQAAPSIAQYPGSDRPRKTSQPSLRALPAGVAGRGGSPGGTDAITPPTPPPMTRPPRDNADGVITPAAAFAAATSGAAQSGAAMWQAAKTEVDPPKVNLDWEDEELSTEVFDKPGQLRLPPTMPEPGLASGARRPSAPAADPATEPELSLPKARSSAPPSLPRASSPGPSPAQRSSVPPPPRRTVGSGPPPPRVGSPLPPRIDSGPGASRASAPVAAPLPAAPGLPPMSVAGAQAHAAAAEAQSFGLHDGALGSFSDGPLAAVNTSIGASPTKVDRKRKIPGAWILVAAFLLGLLTMCVTLGFFVLRPSKGSLAFRTEPANAQVTLDGKALPPGQTSPFVLKDVKATRHTLVVSQPGYRTETRELVVPKNSELNAGTIILRAEGAPDLAKAPDPRIAKNADGTAKGTGFALNTQPPGARVIVDGRVISQRTPVTLSDLDAGTHLVRLELEGNYAPYETQIQIVPGQILSLPEFVLQQDHVRVTFESEPEGAEVTLVRGTIRERVEGVTPARAEVRISLGAWTVEMNARGYKTWMTPLAVPPGKDEIVVRGRLERDDTAVITEPRTGEDTASNSDSERSSESDSERRRRRREAAAQATAPKVDPTPAAPAPDAFGTLRINTRPWSQVFVDGTLIGNTPQMNIRLHAGEHRVLLVNPDFNIRQNLNVTVGKGEVVTKVLTLTP